MDIDMRVEQSLYSSERLKWRLISEYEDYSLEEAIGGKEIRNEEGKFHFIHHENDIDLFNPSIENLYDEFMSDFRLIKGIGKSTESKLKDQGYNKIDDLISHKRFGEKAKELCSKIECQDLYSLQKCVERWHNTSHHLARKLLGSFYKDELLFFDIETMGLRYRPTFLIGTGSYHDGIFEVKQFLARNLNEEKAIIHEFLNELKNYKALVSYNGRSFDSRFLKERMNVLDLNGDLDLIHFDLLHFSRGLWKDRLPNHRLKTVEEGIINKKRKDDVSSALIPHFYELYLRKKNPGPIVPIIEHNKEDISSLALIMNEINKDLE